MSAGHQCVGGTRSSVIVSSVADVLGMSVVCGMRGVGGVCEIYLCWAQGGVASEGVELIRGLVWVFFIPVGTGEYWMCVCVWVAVVWVV